MPPCRFRFAPMSAHDLKEYESWFTDPVLARRMSRPDATWWAYVSEGPHPRAWSAFLDRELVGHLQLDEEEGGRASIAVALKPALRGRRLSAQMVRQFVEEVVRDDTVV